MTSSPVRLHVKGVTVAIRLTPSARTVGVNGLMDSVDGGILLKVSVNVAPENGKANKALIALLSKVWKIPKMSFSLLSGDISRKKVLLIEGVDENYLNEWLESEGFL